MRIYMQIPADDEGAPRYYQLLTQEDLIEGWWVIREWGQQGKAGRVKKEHFENFETATENLLRIRDQQLRRGYQVVFIEGVNPG
jgi:predicted DNA-binding WGR domain protein